MEGAQEEGPADDDALPEHPAVSESEELIEGGDAHPEARAREVAGVAVSESEQLLDELDAAGPEGRS